jgi:hypothetical protein
MQSLVARQRVACRYICLPLPAFGMRCCPYRYQTTGGPQEEEVKVDEKSERREADGPSGTQSSQQDNIWSRRKKSSLEKEKALLDGLKRNEGNKWHSAYQIHASDAKRKFETNNEIMERRYGSGGPLYNRR